MRTLCILLGILWCAGVGLYIGATEYPQELTSSIVIANEWLEAQTGFAIDTAPTFHKCIAGGVVVVMSVVLFLSLLHFIKRTRTLQARIRTDERSMRNAQAVLISFGREQERLALHVRSAEPHPDLAEIVTELETKAQQTEVATKKAEETLASAQELFAVRLQALHERFATLQERSTTLQERATVLSNSIDGVQTTSSEVQEALDKLETDTGGDTLDGLEEQLPQIEKRVTALENISPRVQKLQASLTSLKNRLEKADGTQTEHLSDVLGTCGEVKEELESNLDEIEGDENVENLEEWEGGLPDLEKRVAALETMNQRALALETQLDALDKRLEKANGDSASTLPELLSWMSDDKIGEIQKTLDGIEEDGPDDQIAELEVKTTKLRRRIERVEQANQQVSRLQEELETLEQKAGNLQE